MGSSDRRRGAGVVGAFIVGLVVAGWLVPATLAQQSVITSRAGDELGVDAAAAGTTPTGGLESVSSDSDDGRSTNQPGSQALESAGPTATRPADAGGRSDRPASVVLTASDTGVTAETIKLGIPIYDISAAAAYGLAFESDGLREQREMFTSIIETWNDQGGIHGRRIVPIFAPFNPIDEDDMKAACLRLVEDEKVFAAMAQLFTGAGTLCFTERFGVPILLDDGHADEIYRRSDGLLFSTQPARARAVRNQIWMLHEMGLLKGKTLGALVSEIFGDGDAANEALDPTLDQFGYELAYTARVTSIETMASEIAVGVQQMKAAGVDFIIATQTNVLWNDEAERQNYRPRYSVSDYAQKTRDSAVDDHGKHWDGTIGISSMLWADRGAGVPETPATRSCIDRAAAKGSGPFTRGEVGQEDDSTVDGVGYDIQIAACNLVDVFVLGARAAGPDLTRRGLSHAIQRLGTLDLANVPPSSFAPGKYDLQSTVRPVQWHFDCVCYLPTGPFVANRF